MTKHPRITRRGNVYYHRVMVPKDLVEKYGKRELTKSLHTKELAEAKRLGRILDVKLDEEFEIYRTSMSGETPTIAMAIPSIKQVCDAKFREITEADFSLFPVSSHWTSVAIGIGICDSNSNYRAKTDASTVLMRSKYTLTHSSCDGN